MLGQVLQAFFGHVFKYETDAGPDPPVLGQVFHDVRQGALNQIAKNSFGHDVTVFGPVVQFATARLF